MKQIQYTTIKDSTKNVVYPIYMDSTLEKELLDIFEYDINSLINKEQGKVTKIHTLGKTNFNTMYFIGLGKKETCTSTVFRKTIEDSAKEYNKDCVFYGDSAISEQLSGNKIAQIFTESYIYANYTEMKVGVEIKATPTIEICMNEDVSSSIARGIGFATGIENAKRYADCPANIMTPQGMVDAAIELSNKYDLTCNIINKEQLTQMGAGGILSVNKGSEVPAYMICLSYNNAPEKPLCAIVGKGLTFDSGGYNIKSNSYGMKYDMCGGANTLGIIEVLAALKAKVNVVAIVPTTENLISSKGYKPQDVITTLSKKTIEITNTDAEGRLILCDGLTYAQELNATHIFDLATLTGACVMALGNEYTGAFSNDDEFYQLFEQSSKEMDETVWRMPVGDVFLERLKSSCADLKNSATIPGAGASVAASFLQTFVEPNIKWIHLDIAGTSNKPDKDATGVMIRSVVSTIEKL